MLHRTWVLEPPFNVLRPLEPAEGELDCLLSWVALFAVPPFECVGWQAAGPDAELFAVRTVEYNDVAVLSLPDVLVPENLAHVPRLRLLESVEALSQVKHPPDGPWPVSSGVEPSEYLLTIVHAAHDVSSGSREGESSDQQVSERGDHFSFFENLKRGHEG